MFIWYKAMIAVTQCPQCSTRFNVTQEQLDAREGMVRCGRCQAVFNANEHLVDSEPSPQLSLPIMLDEPPQESPAAKTEVRTNPPAPIAHEPVKFNEPVESVTSAEITQPIEAVVFANPDATTLAQQVIVADKPLHSTHLPPARKSAWPWAVSSLLLLIVLLTQATYYYRVDLAAQLPGLKPTLQTYCQLLNCSIPLPHKSDLVSIESSDMEAFPPPGSTISLSAILRNRAPYAQAFPTLELTLTDAQDKTVARRFIRPSEYLNPEESEAAGIPPQRETSIKLYLDTADLKPAGYRLFLFYP